MRIYLQQRADPSQPPRYVHLILQQDLLGGWTLIRESGQSGRRASLKRQQFLDLDGAQNALIEERDVHLKRGFRVMFSEGLGARMGSRHD